MSSKRGSMMFSNDFLLGSADPGDDGNIFDTAGAPGSPSPLQVMSADQPDSWEESSSEPSRVQPATGNGLPQYGGKERLEIQSKNGNRPCSVYEAGDDDENWRAREELGSDRHEEDYPEDGEYQHDSRYYSIVSDRTSIRTFHTTKSRQAASSRNSAASSLPRRTPWQQILYDKNLILSSFDETNWSGRGQHVEFGPDEGWLIDDLLIPDGVLGHSATTVVEKVRCRRIMLARKKIQCNWRLKREDAIEEVAHLQRLSHAHIQLPIIWTFFDEYSELEAGARLPAEVQEMYQMRQSILRFFTCLSSTIGFLHWHLIKHMDIKPTNLLVQEKGHFQKVFKIYLADFGIARSYSTVADVETDSLTPFSKTYASPEVVRQDVRGFPADIFSLGCVFLEMIAFLNRQKLDLIQIRRQNPTGDMSYQANLCYLLQSELLQRGVREFPFYPYARNGITIERLLYMNATLRMMDPDPDLRPTAVELEGTFGAGAQCCSKGPEPFEAAKFLRLAPPTMEALQE